MRPSRTRNTMSNTEPGLLDVDLAVVGAAVDGRDVLLGLVAGAVLDAELEAARHDQLGGGLRPDRGPELLGPREVGEVLGGQLDVRRRLDDVELGLLLELLLQEPVELGLDVDVGEALVLAPSSASVTRMNGRERDPLVAAQRQLRLEGKAQLDLIDAGEQPGRREQEQRRARRRRGRPARRLGRTGRPFPSSSCRRCRTRRSARSCGGCSCCWARARAPSCTRRAPARSRRSPRGRRRGCCGRARCSGLSGRPARSGTRPRARDPSSRRRCRTRSASRPCRCGGRTCRLPRQPVGRERRCG